MARVRMVGMTTIKHKMVVVICYIQLVIMMTPVP